MKESGITVPVRLALTPVWASLVQQLDTHTLVYIDIRKYAHQHVCTYVPNVQTTTSSTQFVADAQTRPVVQYHPSHQVLVQTKIILSSAQLHLLGALSLSVRLLIMLDNCRLGPQL